MSVETLKTYNQYKEMINEGLIILPDLSLTNIINTIRKARTAKPYMAEGETHEVDLFAKKVQITSRGSLRTVSIDGTHYDSEAQAACSIYDPYDAYYDISYDIRDNMLEYTMIPILDYRTDKIRYTISKYSKGLRKYFDPHKVIKAVYAVDYILFYVNDEDDIKRKYYFKISSLNMNDLMPMICKQMTQKNGLEETFYLAFFKHEEDLPFTVGACQEDFYALKDILNKILFKGTNPLKYMILKELAGNNIRNLSDKEVFAIKWAMTLTSTSDKELCESLYINKDDFDKLLYDNVYEVKSTKGKPVTRANLVKFLNVIDNVKELKYYEYLNLIWKVKYEDIPTAL